MEWISTADRMPPMRERVLIARVYEADGPLIVEQSYRSQEGWWKVFGTNLRDKSVKYWMPMPEPPEEVRNES